MLEFENSLHFAAKLDEDDRLKNFRDKFYFPIINGREVIYLTGNSLGLQPRTTQDYILRELEDWASYGVEGHFHADNPWFYYQDFLTAQIATLLGASANEVVAMNSLTTNLHLLLVSFYRPEKKRYRIICEYDSFPSDLYALQTQARYHGYSEEDAIVYLKPREGEVTLRTEDIIRAIEENDGMLSTVMLGAVNYYTGQYFDIEKITAAAHRAGATAGFNLAHAAGNVEMKLHEWDVDYACFCSYKYLNGGPGGVSGIFVHEKFAAADLPRFGGWWGNDAKTRFSMPRKFVPAEGAAGWQLSNAPVLSMAALRASLDIFSEAGFENLLLKSRQLTSYLYFLLEDINNSSRKDNLAEPLKIITPSNPTERGCQVSFVINENGKEVHKTLSANGVITDWREPDVVRAAPVPLYNSYSDVFWFATILREALAKNKINIAAID